MAALKLFTAICVASVAIGGEPARALPAHHVVGGDHGWDPKTDLRSWSSDRVFTIGDKIWFTYSPAKENVVELRSKEEYEACDVRNPIRMFTDGLDIISLEEEGIRYFVSGKPESCKNGLRLHVEVQPQSNPSPQNNTTSSLAAAPPTTPSASAHLSGLTFGLFGGILVALWS